MTSDERWLSVEEIAGHLGISKETVYRWLEKEDSSSSGRQALEVPGVRDRRLGH